MNRLHAAIGMNKGKPLLGAALYSYDPIFLEIAGHLGFKVIWMQLGVISPEAEKLAKDAGLTVIMDRCPKIEHGRFSGELGWMGVNRKVIDNRKPLLFGKGGSLNRL